MSKRDMNVADRTIGRAFQRRGSYVGAAGAAELATWVEGGAVVVSVIVVRTFHRSGIRRDSSTLLELSNREIRTGIPQMGEDQLDSAEISPKLTEAEEVHHA
jgi:hypothetical protein